MVAYTTLTILSLLASTTTALRETYQVIDSLSPNAWSHLHYTDPLFDRTGTFYNGYLFLNWSSPNATASSCPQDQSRTELWHAVAWIGPPANSSGTDWLEEKNPFQLWIAAWPPTEEFEQEMKEKYGWPGRGMNLSDDQSPSVSQAATGNAPQDSAPIGSRAEAQSRKRDLIFTEPPVQLYPPSEFIANARHLEESPLKDKPFKFFPFEYDTSLYGWNINSHNGAPEVVSEIYSLIEQSFPIPSSDSPFYIPKFKNQTFGPPTANSASETQTDGIDSPNVNLTTYGFKLLPHLPTRAYEDILGHFHTDMLKPDASSNHVLHRSFCPGNDRNFKSIISVDKLKGGVMPWGTGFDEGRFFSIQDGPAGETAEQRKTREGRQRLHFGGDRRIQFNESSETGFEEQFYERMKEYQRDSAPWYVNRSTMGRSSRSSDDLSYFDLRFDFSGWYDAEFSTNMPRFVKRENWTGTQFVWTKKNDASKTIKQRVEVFENATIIEDSGKTKDEAKKGGAERISRIRLEVVIGMVVVAVSFMWL